LSAPIPVYKGFIFFGGIEGFEGAGVINGFVF